MFCCAVKARITDKIPRIYRELRLQSRKSTEASCQGQAAGRSSAGGRRASHHPQTTVFERPIVQTLVRPGSPALSGRNGAVLAALAQLIPLSPSCRLIPKSERITPCIPAAQSATQYQSSMTADIILRTRWECLISSVIWSLSSGRVSRSTVISFIFSFIETFRSRS